MCCLTPEFTVPKQGMTVADKPECKSILADFNFPFHNWLLAGCNRYDM